MPPVLQIWQDSEVLQLAMFWAGIGAVALQGLSVWLALVFKLLLAIKVKKKVAVVVQQFEEVLAADPELRAAVREAQAAGRPLVLPRGCCADRWVQMLPILPAACG